MQADDDRGVTIVLVALTMVALMVIVALVIDFSSVRSTRQTSKSTADAAAAAGLQLLAPAGVPLPWQGVCSAFDYLVANRPELTLTVSYFDGADPAAPVTDPCAAGSSYRGVECDPADPTTWAKLRAVDGTYVAQIESAYTFSGSGFSEDSGAYSGDVGEPLLGGCDQLAVIIGTTENAYFGGIAGATDYDTLTRTVGRVRIGADPNVAIALVLLEQEDCQTLNWAAGSGALTVRGVNRSGIIHSDSAGTGDDCGSGNVVLEGKQNSGPRVRALSSPLDPADHGVISTYSRFLRRTNDAHWTPDRMANDTEVWLCDPSDGSASASPCTTKPTGNKQVTREPADERYLAGAIELRIEAKSVFNQITATPAVAPTGYTKYTSVPGADCNPTGSSVVPTITVAALAGGTKLYVDCPELRIGNGKVIVFDAGITHVAFQGSISFSGSGLLDIRAPEQIFVNNSPGSTDAVSIGSQGTLLVNGNNLASCDLRHLEDESATTEFVIRRGGFVSGAGGTVHLCSTFLHLMGGATLDSPVNTGSGSYPAPYANTSDNGVVAVQAGSHLQWTAPNTVTGGPPTEGDYRFEDLALWTETQNNNEIGGGGDLVLKGVFFLPNTGPSTSSGGLTLSGGSSGSIDLDAQLWVRKLHFNGGAEFRMLSNPADAVTVPFLAGLGLVR